MNVGQLTRDQMQRLPRAAHPGQNENALWSEPPNLASFQGTLNRVVIRRLEEGHQLVRVVVGVEAHEEAVVLLRGFVVVDQQGVQVGVEMLVVALQAFNNLYRKELCNKLPRWQP